MQLIFVRQSTHIRTNARACNRQDAHTGVFSSLADLVDDRFTFPVSPAFPYLSRALAFTVETRNWKTVGPEPAKLIEV